MGNFNTDLQPSLRKAAPRKQLILPLLISLLWHGLLLSLTFAGQDFGLPGFAFPWQDRRIVVPDLQIVLAPPPAAAQTPAASPTPQPALPASIEQTQASGPANVTFRLPERPPEQSAPAAVAQSPQARKARPKPHVESVSAPANEAAEPSPEVLAESPPPPKPFPSVIAMEQSNETAFVVPPAPIEPPLNDSPVPSETGLDEQARIGKDRLQQQIEDAAAREKLESLEAERRDSARQAAARQEQEAQEAARQATARAEAERTEAERRDSARQAAARQEQEAQEAARQATARAEAERIEAERRDSARQAAARQEQERQEAARQAAARAEAERIEAERRDSARQAAARQEQEAQEAARQAAARAEAERRESARQAAARQEQERQEADARRDAARKAMGRQLDEEAARLEAAQAARERSPSASGMRRGRLFGRTDPNAELIQYAEAWSRKIHFNMGFEMVREAAKQPHTDPIVTVAIRSDGSVESVTFVRSSGVPAIDEAIRRIVHGQTPYLPFQPALARDYDVVEIRRTWHFDTAIRLY